MNARTTSRTKKPTTTDKLDTPASPWKDLSADGHQLRVDDFITTRVVRLGIMLRKKSPNAM